MAIETLEGESFSLFGEGNYFDAASNSEMRRR
jgi:hypothetical protein